jgi:hypothetical protein
MRLEVSVRMIQTLTWTRDDTANYDPRTTCFGSAPSVYRQIWRSTTHVMKA